MFNINAAYDFYQYGELLATAQLRDGKFNITGPKPEGLRNVIDGIRQRNPGITDADILRKLPSFYRGVTHMALHGESVSVNLGRA